MQIISKIKLLLIAFRVINTLPKGKHIRGRATAMTRFEREISGNLGEAWKKRAEREVKEAVGLANRIATVEADGAIR